MTLPKKVKNRPNPPGLDERRDLLAAHGLPRELTAARPPRGAGPDDLLDAYVLALVARRIARGEAVSFPPDPPRDARGLPIAITA
jgi:predicted RNase H-like nuclease